MNHLPFLSASLLLFDFSNAAAAEIPNRELLPLYLLTSPTVKSIGNILNKWTTVITGLDVSMNLSKMLGKQVITYFLHQREQTTPGFFQEVGEESWSDPGLSLRKQRQEVCVSALKMHISVHYDCRTPTCISPLCQRKHLTCSKRM